MVGKVVSIDGCNTSRIMEVVLSSSRRVKEGAGRRPQSAKRQRFVELRQRGWSILAAAGEVGVSSDDGEQLVAWLQDLPPRSGRWVRTCAGPPGLLVLSEGASDCA
jgi:hypothetical protein